MTSCRFGAIPLTSLKKGLRFQFNPAELAELGQDAAIPEAIKQDTFYVFQQAFPVDTTLLTTEAANQAQRLDVFNETKSRYCHIQVSGGNNSIQRLARELQVPYLILKTTPGLGSEIKGIDEIA